MLLEDYTNVLTAELKSRKYRKNKLTWHKKTDDGLTVVFSIQKSQYGADVWYYNFGVIIDDLAERQSVSYSACHVLYRVDQYIRGIMVTTGDIIQILDLWENRFGDMRSLRLQAIEGKLNGFLIDRRVMRYLTTVRLG